MAYVGSVPFTKADPIDYYYYVVVKCYPEVVNPKGLRKLGASEGLERHEIVSQNLYRL